MFKVVRRAYHGDDVAAKLRELRALIGDASQGSIALCIPEAEGETALALGRLSDARRAHHDIARLMSVLAPEAYIVAGRAAIWSGDVEGAREDLRALEGTRVDGAARATAGARSGPGSRRSSIARRMRSGCTARAWPGAPSGSGGTRRWW